MTAQRKDINDPAIIHEFALLVGESQYLDYLYILTVSDIRATSPKVWNSWKDSLLSQLYNLTKAALTQGLENPQQQDECIKDCKTEALKQLIDKHYSQEKIQKLWISLPNEYFVKFQIEEIVWQTQGILDIYQKSPELAPCLSTHSTDITTPMILIKAHEEHGGKEIFIFTLEKDHLFALVTATLAQLVLDVTAAKTVSLNNGCTYHTYFVLEGDGSIVTDQERTEGIQQVLKEKLSQEEFTLPSFSQRLSRTQKQFSHKTSVQFDEDLENNQTIMTISASNRPALLSHIGQALIECHVLLDNAKISTFGEKVEDVFIIRDENKQIITDIKTQETIRRAIIKRIDELE